MTISITVAIALALSEDSRDRSRLLDNDTRPFSIHLSQDGRTLAVAGNTPKGGDWKIFDLAGAKVTVNGMDFQERCHGAFGVAMTRDNALLAFGGNGEKLFLVDVKNRRLYWDLTDDGHDGIINNICFNRDGNRMISVAKNGKVRIWDVEKKALLAALNFSTRSARFLERGKKFAAHLTEGDFYALGMRFVLSADEKTIILGGSFRGQVSFVECATGKIQKRLPLNMAMAACLQATPDGKWLVVGGTEGDAKIEIWDLETDKLVTSFQGHEETISHLAISPDKKTLISGGVFDGFRVWDVATGKQKFSYFTKEDPRMPRVKVIREDAKPFVENETRSAGCAFLPDGKTFLIVPHWALWGTEVYFHDTATGRPVDYRERVKALPRLKDKCENERGPSSNHTYV